MDHGLKVEERVKHYIITPDTTGASPEPRDDTMHFTLSPSCLYVSEHTGDDECGATPGRLSICFRYIRAGDDENAEWAMMNASSDSIAQQGITRSLASIWPVRSVLKSTSSPRFFVSEVPLK